MTPQGVLPLVTEAARAAVAPEGAPGWFTTQVEDGVALRTVARRWSQAAEPPARLARTAGGAALYAARIALAAHGRRAVVTTPGTPGLIAVVRPGVAAAPRPAERAAYAVLRHGPHPTVRLRPRAVVPHVRRAAEAEGAWLGVVELRPGATLGPHWRTDREPVGESVTVLLDVPGESPWVEVQAGQAIQAVVLTAGAAGLHAAVLAAPADPAVLRRRLTGPGAAVCGRTVAVLVVGDPVPRRD
ncbi:hypothetical protein GCM10023175_17100 [Pseudonocardia xishanensis]|uniref:Uncharacterized protein n=2 Tax=Pseudonocardia xishanensis TaxID=630995 RepID=A0ABP8RNH2_9PSEU